MIQYLKIDEQTINDLSIFGKHGKPSIYELYDNTVTQGGSGKLKTLFRNPLSDEESINQKMSLYKFFSLQPYQFPIDNGIVATLSYYMENEDVRSQLQVGGQSLGQKFKDMVSADATYVFVQDGVQAGLRFFQQLEQFLQKIEPHVGGSIYDPVFKKFIQYVNALRSAGIPRPVNSKPAVKLNAVTLFELDKIMRFDQREHMLELLYMIYELDVCIAVGQLARNRGFCFGKATPKDSGSLYFKNVFHPHVESAVPNDLELNREHNILFLTGANMAGKSTLMKSIGVALYLGHMGFPVAAQQFEFAVRDGIYTSINLADNLSTGASHYYAEVLRVKEVAIELSQGKQLFVIFDELFRGTNVKDAYEATIALTTAFCNKRNSQFIISTHIMEAGEMMRGQLLPIKYQFLPTEMKGNVPVYLRVLKEGITEDRQGMIIIQNEGILDMLDAGLKQKEETGWDS